MPRERTRPTRQETEERVIEGARAAFVARGFNATRVEDICKAAGLSRGAFYSGYRSKEELFFELYDRNTIHIRAFIDAALKDQPAESVTVESIVSAIAKTYALDRDWFVINAEFTLYAIRTPDVADRLIQRRRTMRKMIGSELKEAMERSGRVLRVDIDLAARAIVALTDGGLGQSLIEPAALKSTTMIEAVLGPLLHALSESKCGSDAVCAPTP